MAAENFIFGSITGTALTDAYSQDHASAFNAAVANIPPERLLAMRSLIYRLVQEGASWSEASPQLQCVLY